MRTSHVADITGHIPTRYCSGGILALFYVEVLTPETLYEPASPTASVWHGDSLSLSGVRFHPIPDPHHTNVWHMSPVNHQTAWGHLCRTEGGDNVREYHWRFQAQSHVDAAHPDCH